MGLFFARGVPRRCINRGGFTLIELLVVIGIIGILVGMLLPAAQLVRGAARRIACGNHLRQMAIGTLNFESTYQRLPSSWKLAGEPTSGNVAGWSAQAQILPFLEQGNLFEKIDFEKSYNDQPLFTLENEDQRIQTARIPIFLCPSEIRDEARLKNGVREHYPLNYGGNAGTWFVFDPATKRVGDGVILTGRHLPISGIADGSSNTLLFAEVKAFTPYFRNAGIAGAVSMPPGASMVSELGGQFKSSSGHTEWVDGRVHQTGFTATFPPNTVVPFKAGNSQYDVDWTNQQEGKSGVIGTFAAVTSRSYHQNGVNTARSDGSVQFVSDAIQSDIWKALATRDGGEVRVR